jgi:2-hydroxy-3-keto-5-methylthiopentenyl-1-phosphate phosphatase
VPSIPVFTAETTFDGAQAAIAFPNGQPDCFVCGTCKRRRVLAHQAAGRSVVLIGDGETDRYAAAYADHIFAKRDLIRLCSAEGWPFTPGATSGS